VIESADHVNVPIAKFVWARGKLGTTYAI
jgi:hypothetical protein